MSIMASKCCAVGLFLVLLFWDVHCYPYQQAYRMGQVYPRTSTLYGPLVKPSQSDTYTQYFLKHEPITSGSSLPGPVDSRSPIDGCSNLGSQCLAPLKTDASPYVIPQAPEQTGCRSAGLVYPSYLPLPPLCESSPSKFQAGDISHFESVYEHGNSQSEFEDQRFPLPEGAVEAGSIPAPLPATIARSKVIRPEPSQEDFEDNYSELFITGKFPAGTITNLKTKYEHGNDQWSAAGFVQYRPAPVQYRPAPVQYRPAPVQYRPASRTRFCANLDPAVSWLC
eukprot:XP_014061565.1 PREDICTED: uncharacterized protein LOC106608248 [Salmo salar]